MVRARKYVVTKTFKGEPKRSDFEIVQYELPPLKDGEILVKVEWISVDPYLRKFNEILTPPYDQFSFHVGVVQESKSSKFPVGTKLVTHKGWCDYVIIDTAEEANRPTDVGDNYLYKIPDMKGLPESLAIGTVGMPGATAYLAFLEVCKPQPGETVVVSGAAGAVGSLVGQIAKIKGCKVIGFAGSELKVQLLEKELGFDKAFNYKTVDLQKALKEAAPNGVDCYFDNVGGEISSVVINQMNIRGRIAVVGAIATYNEDPTRMSKATVIQQSVVFKQLTLQGFVIFRWFDRWNEAFKQLVDWTKEGKLQAREHVTEGFENVFDAFVGLFRGENTGKAVVKV